MEVVFTYVSRHYAWDCDVKRFIIDIENKEIVEKFVSYQKTLAQEGWNFLSFDIVGCPRFEFENLTNLSNQEQVTNILSALENV